MATASGSLSVRKRAVLLAIGLTAPSIAHAQDPAPVQDENVITVTGTRIQRPDASAASPVVSFDAEKLAAHGSNHLEDFLNTLPQAIPNATRASNNPGEGTADVNLRGLGRGCVKTTKQFSLLS